MFRPIWNHTFIFTVQEESISLFQMLTFSLHTPFLVNNISFSFLPEIIFPFSLNISAFIAMFFYFRRALINSLNFVVSFCNLNVA